MSWSHRQGNWDGVWELHRAGTHVASVWWFHDPVHVAVAMTRIVDRLNLPAAECAPSPAPSWSVTVPPCEDAPTAAAWGTFTTAGVEAMAVVWQIEPRRLAGWHQRILDALNAGRGLPAVELANPSQQQHQQQENHNEQAA